MVLKYLQIHFESSVFYRQLFTIFSFIKRSHIRSTEDSFLYHIMFCYFLKLFSCMILWKIQVNYSICLL